MSLTDAELDGALRDERPSIDAEFAAMLDERAARGCPRESASPLDALVDRLRAVPPRRLIAPAGAVATLLVVVGVSISTLGGGGRQGRASSLSAPATPAEQAVKPAATSGASAGGGTAAPAIGETRTLNAPAAT